MKPVVTFDFDETLSRSDVQEYARELIALNVDVWVLTSRYDDIHKHLYPKNPTNEDLYAVTDALKIPRSKIRFQLFRKKSEFLKGTRVLWHLDDDEIELDYIKLNTDVKPIAVYDKDWKEQCDLILHFYNYL